MRGRVCHLELGSASTLELVQRALESCTDKHAEVWRGLDLNQCEDLLRREMRKQAVFLAINDNMSDRGNSTELARIFLNAGFKEGSIVIVTSRSLNLLKLCCLNIDEGNCLEMPELERDEAKALFMHHANCEYGTREGVNDEIIGRCLNRCYFQKGDGKSYHYHPLALKVLGIQLGCSKYDPVHWREQLQELDTFNQQRELEHPIFSILRKSFDTLKPEDQMLFVDVALFLPENIENMEWSVFEWLSVVHGIRVRNVMESWKVS